MNKPMKKKRIREPIPEDITFDFVIDRTGFMDSSSLIPSDFDDDDWLNPKS